MRRIRASSQHEILIISDLFRSRNSLQYPVQRQAKYIITALTD